MIYSNPTATIISCKRLKDIILTRLTLNQVVNSPKSPASLYIRDIFEDEKARAVFQLHRLVKCQDDQFDFETYEEYEPQSSLLSKGDTYYYVGQWSPEQLELAKSDPSTLRQYLFEPKSKYDHDHCFLCWKTICDCEGADHEAYTNGRFSLCFECFERYISSGFGKLLGDAA